MNLLDKHIAYLKDNPKGYWFKRKLYGWGWTPVTWQGWLTLILYIVGVISIVLHAEPALRGQAPAEKVMVLLVLLTALLLTVCYKKGEKPRWQWGLSKDEDKSRQ